MLRIVILRGLPASGKSMHAAQLVMKGYKRINNDDLRILLDNGIYSKSSEDFINSVNHMTAEFALRCNYNVVVDNINFNQYHINYYKDLAKRYNAEVEILDFNTPLEVCLERDLQRTRGRVGKSVIMKIYTKYFKDGKFPEVQL